MSFGVYVFTMMQPKRPLYEKIKPVALEKGETHLVFRSVEYSKVVKTWE